MADRTSTDRTSTDRTSTDAVLRDLRAGVVSDDLLPPRRRAPRPPVRPAPGAPGQGGEVSRHRAADPEPRGCARGLARGLGVLLVVVALTLGARAFTGSDQPVPVEPAASSVGDPASVDDPAGGRWQREVARLDAARTAALAAGDVSGLRAVHVAGSEDLRADRQAVRALRRAGIRPVGLRSRLTDVAVVRQVSDERVVLRVVDRRSAYRLVDRAGTTVERVAGAPSRTWRVVLQRVAGTWRLAAVSPAD